MKQRMIYAALAVLALSAPAAAQGYERGYPPGPGYAPGDLPPHEIRTILRSTGLDPVGPPMRRGPNYVMRAIDNADREVRVVIRARSGRILAVTPVVAASHMPPRGDFTMGAYERMPQGYVPPDSYRPDSYRPGPRVGNAGPPAVDEDDELIAGDSNVPRPPNSVQGAPPHSSTAMRTLPPRGGAMRPDDNANASPPSGPNVITADPDRSGMLPPPPERFPQRVAPTAPPKPVKRAAAAPPKQAPLPRPRPNVEASSPPPPPPSQPPAAAAPAPDDSVPN